MAYHEQDKILDFMKVLTYKISCALRNQKTS